MSTSTVEVSLGETLAAMSRAQILDGAKHSLRGRISNAQSLRDTPPASLLMKVRVLRLLHRAEVVDERVDPRLHPLLAVSLVGLLECVAPDGHVRPAVELHRLAAVDDAPDHLRVERALVAPG